MSVVLTGHRDQPAPPDLKPGHRAEPKGPQKVPGIERIVAIAGGKGGVGKSTVAANLACALAAQGRRVGLLDADVYGPSQPRMLGVSGRPSSPGGKTVLPMRDHRVTMMSIGLMTNDDQAVVRRGPMLMGALQQMLTQVQSAALDVLSVDLPPGTGDVQMTRAQKAEVDGAIIISTPQDVTLLDARKGIDMFRQLGVPLLAEIPLHLDIRLAADGGLPLGCRGAHLRGECSSEVTFPPLMSGQPVTGAEDPFLTACMKAALGCDAGLVVYNLGANTLSAALVVAPEVALQDAMAMLPACGVGLQNALGALAPPEVAVHLEWAGGLRVNGAKCGCLRVAASAGDPEALTDALADHFVAYFGAPDAATARPVAAEEIGHMLELCDEHDDNTLLTVARKLAPAGVREAYRVIEPQEPGPDICAVHGALDE